MKPSQKQSDHQAEIREELRSDNLELLRSEITGKEILLKTNTHFDRKERKYFVEEVKDEYIKEAGKLIRGVRLVNHKFPKEEQPLLKYPSEYIEKTIENNKNKLVLQYTSEVNIGRDFKRLYRDTIQDLEIYLYY
ncbi:hypothetical protein HY792_06215 [Candidatus Desantisbacteria bacterium]|nr:hypothetical protein [Candidatus Desantisbacteria bacterium]